MNSLYFDHAAAVPVSQATLLRLAVLFQSFYANQEASGYHGARAADAAAGAAHRLGRLFGGESDPEVLFGHTGTEVISDVFRILAMTTPGGTILASDADHACVRASLDALPHTFTRVSVPLLPSGGVDPFRFEAAAKKYPDCVLASIPFVTAETGAVNDPSVFRRILAKYHPAARLFCDAVQGAGKLPFDWNAAQPDFFTLSGQKLGVPSGAALLLHRDFLPAAKKLRNTLHAASRLPVPFAVLLTERAEELLRTLPERLSAVKKTKKRLLEILEREIPSKYRLTLPEENSSPYITHLLLSGGVQGAIVVRALSALGISAASGSACDAETKNPSRVLTAMGIGRTAAYGALRISYSEPCTDAELEEFVRGLKKTLAEY